MVLVEITPEPDDAERKAILAVLADEPAEQSAGSGWSASLLPSRDDGEP